MRYRLIPGGYVDETGPHRGVPPTQEDFDRIALVYAHRTLFTPMTPKEREYVDSIRADLELTQRLLYGPYDMEFTQELPIEEVKKRYPDAEISEENK
jgi:hypothetical protein